MDTQTIQHYEDTISRLRQELSQSPNSRQARRERLMAGLISGDLVSNDIGGWSVEDVAAHAEDLLDASDAIDKEKP